MGKITTAVFEPGSTTANVYGLWQYDYGQTLRIQGLNLPSAVEIHFSLQETGGTSLSRVGVTKDGVTDVIIPDSMLENDNATRNYDMFAFVYLTDDTSGQTEYKIKLQIKSRPKPEVPGGGENPDIFHEAVQAVRRSADQAAESEKQAEGWAHGREDLPERAEDNAKYYVGKASEDAKKTAADRTTVESAAQSVAQMQGDVAKDLEQVQTLTGQAQTSATNAALSEQAAKASEIAAQEAQVGAETAEGHAERFAGHAAADKAAVELIKSEADKTAQKITEDKNTVQGLVDDFALTHQQAVVDVNNAGQTQTERVENAGETAVDNIETSRQQAVESVSDEGTTQKEAVKTEGTTQIENVQAVVDGIAQESTAQQILEKSNQSLPFLEEIARNSGKAGSLNGFCLEKGANDSVVITYTNPETEQFESATVLPTDTTLLKIDEALTGINESLKIIALQKGVET